MKDEQIEISLKDRHFYILIKQSIESIINTEFLP